MKTWHVEAVVVAVVLAAVVLSDRLAERKASRALPTVSYHKWIVRYFVMREAAWFAYFVTGRCWSALVGCALFLAYPAWRRWWRARHPLAAEEIGGAA